MEEPLGVAEKILVCIHYRPNAEKLIRRGWRIASCLNASLVILHVTTKSKVRFTNEDHRGMDN